MEIHFFNKYRQKILELQHGKYDIYNLVIALKCMEEPKYKERINQHMTIVNAVLYKEYALEKTTLYLYLISIPVSIAIIFIALKTPKEAISFGNIILPIIVSITTLSMLILRIYYRGMNRRKYPVEIIVNNIITTILLIHPDLTLYTDKYVKEKGVASLLQLLDKYSLNKTQGNDFQDSSTNKKTRIINLNQKKYVLIQLEETARCIEYYIPLKLRSGDILTDNWFEDAMRQAGSAVREKKKWILTPMEDTYDNLITAINMTLTHIISDNWDALEKMEAPTKSQKNIMQSFISSAKKTIKTILVAILPLIGFVCFQLTPFAVNGQIRDYIFIGTLIWLGITALVSLDSGLSTKLSLLKDTKDILKL